jgi:hypothetical protein
LDALSLSRQARGPSSNHMKMSQWSRIHKPLKFERGF